MPRRRKRLEKMAGKGPQPSAAAMQHASPNAKFKRSLSPTTTKPINAVTSSTVPVQRPTRRIGEPIDYDMRETVKRRI